MRQINFTLIFVFGLGMVYFTLENTAATTVHVLPGLEYTTPLAALLLLSAGEFVKLISNCALLFCLCADLPT